MTIQLAMANEGKAVSRQVAREIWKADSTLRSKLNLEYSPHPPGGGAGGGGGWGGLALVGRLSCQAGGHAKLGILGIDAKAFRMPFSTEWTCS